MSVPVSPLALPWLDPHRIDEIRARAEDLLRVVLGPSDDSRGAPPSIFDALVERRDRCRPDVDDWHALAPQPEVDDLLSRMVGILRGEGLRAHEFGISAAVDRVMSSRVDGCPKLKSRAGRLRKISEEAETEMERFFSDRWFTLLTDTERFGPGPRSLGELMSDFPYCGEYRDLVAAEAALLSTSERIIFAGGGPLPISGLLLAAITGADVVLVDVDGQAVERSTQLIGALERRGLVPRGQIEVRHQDLSEVSLDEPCGGVVVASLVDTEAKVGFARRLAESVESSPPLVLRSAIGMCARLAYHAAPREAVVAAGLEYRGELVPANHVVSGLDPVLTRPFDVRSDQADDLLGILPASVLNSAELYVAAGGERP